MPTVSYASIGAALGALGEAVAAQGSAEAVAAGRYISAAGTYADGIEGAIEGDTASHIMAGILGGVLLEAGIPISTAAPALLAALPAGLPPVVAGLAAAVILGALYYYGGEAIAAASAVLGSALADLLADALSDPLVLDLDGDGLELVSLAQSATHFDLDDDGAMERTGWVSPQDGLLVQDANGNGVVDGVAELLSLSYRAEICFKLVDDRLRFLHHLVPPPPRARLRARTSACSWRCDFRDFRLRRGSPAQAHDREHWEHWSAGCPGDIRAPMSRC